MLLSPSSVGFTVVVALWFSVPALSARTADDEFSLQAQAARLDSSNLPSVGDGFTMLAATAPHLAAAGADLKLESSCVRGGKTGSTDPCGCLCSSSYIFGDGFESGDTSAWSSTQSLRPVAQGRASDRQNPTTTPRKQRSIP